MFARFAFCQRGQDLVEYVLLLALAVLATTALMVTAGQSMSAVWSNPNLTSPDAAQGAGQQSR